MPSLLRAAIIGAGPSGFYAAAQLLAADELTFAVDVYDRLPTPYGLVRAGVAPDHPKIKSVTQGYAKTARHDRFRFFGDVELGSGITRQQLLANYHAIIYAIGTAEDKRLRIPGEDLRGSYPATEFVAWYNGHPDHCDLEVDLRATHAVVIGGGNVALDVARMLALTPAELATTDTADHAIDVLAGSGIEDITILVRRGPLQAAFTNPELLEIGELTRADVEVIDGELHEIAQAALADADRTRTRNVELIQEYAHRPGNGKPMTVRFRFLASPAELLGDDAGHVRAVRVERNAISRRPDGSIAAHGTGEFTVIPAQLVLRSIGYVGRPVAGIPFDAERGVICHRGGRVTDADGAHCVGEYVTGWIKRGPSGVIGTNKKDSRETVDRILADAAAGHLNEPAADNIELALGSRAEPAVSWEGWEAIDYIERLAGTESNPARPRVKLAGWEALRRAAGAGRPRPSWG